MPRTGDKHHTPIGKKKASWYLKIEILEEFKERCQAEGRPQNEVLHELMEHYLNSH